MPAAYTHYCFGKEVENTLPNAIRTLICKNSRLYELGLYGPDLLFYYGLPGKSAKMRLGFLMHKKPASVFFEQAKKILKESETDNDQATDEEKDSYGPMLAYCFGAICHFVLDSECHSYITYEIRKNHMNHTKMEMDLEHYFMIQNHKNPILFNPISLKITKNEACMIAKFYEGVSPRQIGVSLQHMRRFSGVIRCSSNQKCESTTKELLACYEKAKPIAQMLINNFNAYINGCDSLHERFQKTYGADEERVSQLMNA